MLRWSTTKTHDTTPSIIKRTAIDLSGLIGSLYNACRDRIVGTLNVTLEKTSDQLYQITQCTIKKGMRNQNLLELIDIDEQLRLSLLLNLTPKTGIGTIIDHPYLINEYTRIFRYTYIHREERLTNEIQNMREWLTTIIPETNITHIITNISWGIDIIIIFQLPQKENIVTMIDLTLEKYRAYLNGERNDFKRTRDDINSIINILDTKIYSNISNLTQLNNLHDLFHNISHLKINHIDHQRLIYTLYPIQSFFIQHPSSKYIYIPLDSNNNNKLQQYLFELLTSIKLLETYFNEDILNLLCGHFTERFSNVYNQWLIIKNEFISLYKQYEELIINIRCGLIRISILIKKLENKTQLDIKKRIHDLIENVFDLMAKGHLINDLNHQQIQYYNVIECDINSNDIENLLKMKLNFNETYDRVLCSNDFLNKNNPDLLKELRRILCEEHEINSKLRLIYADFSYCNYPLENMMILPSIKDLHITDQSFSRLSTNETINILLLGEIGVGKSTFINALVNYLTFKTFDNAQSNKPLIVIPVSFVITDDDNFNEYTVKLNDTNNSTNEDFEHPGQTVTQQCRSYIYNLNKKIKLRLIDTPGFGDIRGFDQDEQTMKHILNYIKKFSHLNAICFLLKPNESKLNIFFPSCLIQLFNLLGPTISDNLIFCFTNIRSNFNNLENTILILKNILSSFTNYEILFQNKNLFFFDNESFRYLIALQNHISFNNNNNNHHQQIYAMSWTNSIMELNRLIRYISKKLMICLIPNEDHAIKYTEIKIVHLTRSIIETIRYILRNIIINKMNSFQYSIEIQNENYNYIHLPYQIILLEFLKDYKILNKNLLSQKQDNMIDHLSLLCYISAKLSYFLIYIAHYRNQDPFLIGLLRLIKEENDICENQNRNYMNLQLVDCLKKLTNNYKQYLNIIKSNPNTITLTEINEWIKYISEYPLISEYIIDNYQNIVQHATKISSV